MSATVIPCLRYRNAPAAIQFLKNVLGFEEHLVVPGDGNVIHHAQLKLGTGMIMLGTAAETAYDSIVKQPDEIEGRETQSPYVIVEDADAVYASVKAAGWKIVVEIVDEDYGGRGFSCADPEGHVWNIGTYNPWLPA